MCIYIYVYVYIIHIYIYIYVHVFVICIYIYIYILSGPRERWESFRIVSIGHTPAQRKRNGKVDGNVTETLTEA